MQKIKFIAARMYDIEKAVKEWIVGECGIEITQLQITVIDPVNATLGATILYIEKY